MKYSFKNDYSEGCHPKVIEELIVANTSQQSGYGLDDYSKEAERLILESCNASDSKIFFVSGGTLANLLVIDALLKPYEAVISADSGHINLNEAGAIENTGHKIVSIFSKDGKLSPELISPILESTQNFPHQVKPKLVYISNSTELGTIYSKTEVENLSKFCKQNNLYFFMDGARLGHALMSEKSDLSLKDIAKLTDVFYIGGTKNGAMFGEAVVVNDPELLQDFPFYIKQNGGLLAKGRFLGVQFIALFSDGLYFELAQKANLQAEKLKIKFKSKQIKFLTETSTNQIFPILNNRQIEQLSVNFEFYVWEKLNDNQSAIRLVTSWATPDHVIDFFVSEIEKL